VPTLILSGEDDLRTPTSGAREVAAAIPGAQLLVVPNTGHSVLGSDPTPCAHDALKLFFEGRRAAQCKDRTPPPLALPTPLPPRSLREVPVARHNPGKAGRTLQAAVLTLADFDRQILLAVIEKFAEATLDANSVRTGGLRAGWGGFASEKIELHGYSYVPGVTVSGTLDSSGSGTLRIGGRAAARGTLRIGKTGSLAGVLGGVRVRVGAPRASAGALELAPSASAARLSVLLAHTRQLQALRDGGIAALLRYVYGG